MKFTGFADHIDCRSNAIFIPNLEENIWLGRNQKKFITGMRWYQDLSEMCLEKQQYELEPLVIQMNGQDNAGWVNAN